MNGNKIRIRRASSLGGASLLRDDNPGFASLAPARDEDCEPAVVAELYAIYVLTGVANPSWRGAL
jgi:hypothetical protein